MPSTKQQFLIEEMRERSRCPDYVVVEAASIGHLLERLRGEFLSYDAHSRDLLTGAGNYQDWRVVCGGQDVDAIEEVRIYPLGGHVLVPLEEWGKAWDAARTDKNRLEDEAVERAEYARLHAKYGQR